MFKTFRLATCASLLSLSPVLTAQASAAELKVVASFSIIADFAKNVGGDRVEITTLVGPDGDAHVYEPRPADAVAVSKADVVLVNGLEFEGFLKRLIETSGTKAPVVELTKGVEPLRLSDEPAGTPILRPRKRRLTTTRPGKPATSTKRLTPTITTMAMKDITITASTIPMPGSPSRMPKST